MDFAQLLAAVPDIGDKQAREMAIARLAHAAGAADERAKWRAKVPDTAGRVLADAMATYGGSRETPDYAVELALWLDEAGPCVPVQRLRDAEAIACDCQTVTHADGARHTTCGSEQMQRAVSEGHAFARVDGPNV